MERGRHLERQGRFDEAMLEFKQAIEADPSFSRAHTALGQHYRRKGLLTKAADEFKMAVLLGGDYLTNLDLGRTLRDIERFSEAQEAFQRCLDLDPEDPQTHYEMASVLFTQGAFGQALQSLQAIAGDRPHDPDLQLALADCHLALKDYDAAERVLVGALERAESEDHRASLLDALCVTRRHREFVSKETLSVKDLLYALQGVVCLGCRRDDGLEIPLYEDYAFTYADVAATCRRLLSLQLHLGGSFDAVCAVDAHALPLTLALGTLLSVPTRALGELRQDELTLVVLATVLHPELWLVTLEHITTPTRSFALAMTWQPDRAPAADLVGIPCSGSCLLPSRREPKPSPVAASESILRAYADQSEDENLTAQIAYYGKDHRLLRFRGDTPSDVGGQRARR
jgi:lipoprotein NlpI